MKRRVERVARADSLLVLDLVLLETLAKLFRMLFDALSIVSEIRVHLLPEQGLIQDIRLIHDIGLVDDLGAGLVENLHGLVVFGEYRVIFVSRGLVDVALWLLRVRLILK